MTDVKTEWQPGSAGVPPALLNQRAGRPRSLTFIICGAFAPVIYDCRDAPLRGFPNLQVRHMRSEIRHSREGAPSRE
ncbi:hypothetical protein FACS1894158_00650 [Betaproteobacteria bacterium]|nr:hypothetical protein FACS1894158_00650 [Betaproteobacteria bacterium]